MGSASQSTRSFSIQLGDHSCPSPHQIRNEEKRLDLMIRCEPCVVHVANGALSERLAGGFEASSRLGL